MRGFFLLFIVVLAGKAFSQIVETSSPGKLPNKTSKFKILGKNNDGLVVRLYGAEDVINIYNGDLKLAASKTMQYKNQDGLSQYIMLNKTGAVVFYLLNDKRYSILYAQPVNSKFIEIGNPKAIDTIYDRKDLVAANLRFKPSADQNYLFIYYPFFEGNTVQYVRYMCVDHALNTLYLRNVPVNRHERELEESKALIDNQGNATIILKPDTKGVGAQFDFFRITNVGDLRMYSITTDHTIFGEAVFEEDNKNGNIVFSHFYDDATDRRTEPAAAGFYYGVYDPQTGDVLQSAKLPFTSAFMTELTGRQANDKNRLYTFVIKKVVLRNDGGALVVAESFIKDTREVAMPLSTQPNFNNYRTVNIYQFNDIIAFSFNGKAEQEWFNIMRKKQASEDDSGVFSSFLIVNEKDRLRMLYLDDISLSGALTQYTLTSEGKSERKTIFNQGDKDLLLLPKMGKQISPAEAVIPSYKNGYLQLVKLTF